MKNPSREQVYAALFALVSSPSMLVANGGPFVTISRRPRLWDYYSADQKPFLGQFEEKESYVYNQNQTTPGAITLEPEFFIYTDVGNDDVTNPSPIVNNCIDALETILQPSLAPGAVQDLGGLVTWCRIDGNPKKAPGYLDGQGFAIVQMKILVPF